MSGYRSCDHCVDNQVRLHYVRTKLFKYQINTNEPSKIKQKQSRKKRSEAFYYFKYRQYTILIKRLKTTEQKLTKHLKYFILFEFLNSFF